MITSATGAAIHDIIRIAGRRYPLAEILLYPALVQGSGAAQSLIGGVEFFNAVDLVDLIIIGRGGGSVEDLWAFNDEGLARAVAASALPVISAVGHESDVTICDFVADLRAPTPSGAAELAVPDAGEIQAQLDATMARLTRAVSNHLGRARQSVLLRFSHRMLASPRTLFDERRMHLCQREQRLIGAVQRQGERLRAQLGSRAARLDALSPLSVLSRGYAMVTSEQTGNILSSASKIEAQDKIRLCFGDGSVLASVEEVSLKK